MKFNRGIGATFFVAALLVGCNRAKPAPKEEDVVVKKGEIVVSVVESGVINPFKVVEIKSRVAGRVKQIQIEEGDLVQAGQLIAIIDPKETMLQVEQNRAQLRGAQASIRRTDVEISQRRITSATQVQQARIRLAQLEKELSVQPTLTQSSITAAQSALNTAQQQRRLLTESTQPNERTVLAAEVKQAQDSKDNAERELNRLVNLNEQDFVSKRDVENQRLQVSLAESRLNSAQDRLRRLQVQQATELRTADERIRQAEAELKRAKANTVQDDVKRKEVENARVQLRQAEASLRDVDAMIASRAQSSASADQLRSILSDSERQLSETEIRAPITGLIAKKLIQEGELVSSLSSFSSGTPIAQLEDRSKMIVKLNINEIDVAKLALGLTARIDVDAIPGETFDAKVTKIAPSKVANATGTDPVVRYEVEVTLQESSPKIKTGMTAKCTIDVETAKGVLLVPIDYLVKENGETFVMVKGAKPTDKATKTKVQIGAESATSVQILTGVNEGAKLAKPDFSGPARRSGMEMN